MKAINMSISIPVEGKCNKNCPYCISKMTEPCEHNEFLWKKNLIKAWQMTRIADVTSIIITGKSEPLLNIPAIKTVCSMFRKYPLEIQTNGILLTPEIASMLQDENIDTIAISVDTLTQLNELSPIIKEIVDRLDMTIRITFNLSTLLTKTMSLASLFNFIHKKCTQIGVSQISYRDITAPNTLLKAINAGVEKNELKIKTAGWVKNNVDVEFNSRFLDYVNNTVKNGTKICTLPYGAIIYMYQGISYTYFEYCIQDENTDDDIRSLVYYDDGHLSRSWNGSYFGRIF